MTNHTQRYDRPVILSISYISSVRRLMRSSKRTLSATSPRPLSSEMFEKSRTKKRRKLLDFILSMYSLLTCASSTAYGADATVPGRGEVDVLVAGFACVDFSHLNTRRKGLDGEFVTAQVGKKGSEVTGKGKTIHTSDEVSTQDEIETNTALHNSQRGESGDTLFSILEYANKRRPPITLLENVNSAPWGEIKEKWHRIGYAAEFCKMDTKHYYLPHTRQRIYMLCLDKTTFDNAEEAVLEWKNLVENFRRNASAPVDAFILDEGDTRLAEATRELTRANFREKASKEVGWTRSQVRHLHVRQDEDLGDGRPITLWTANGSSGMLDYANHEWTKGQVLRVKDNIDLTWLRAALKGYDPAYKPRYPDMSQDIDRHSSSGAWGITGCLTPGGLPYSTSRGGPIVGYESLSLQGIPIEKLLLTRETQRQLQDLAGNAMTSTVVGVALISALIVAHRAIPKLAKAKRQATAQEILPRIIHPNTLTRALPVRFGSDDVALISDILSFASATAQFCACEGQQFTTPMMVNIYKCRDCSFMACDKCAGIPRHAYQCLDAHRQNSRKQPSMFRERIKNALPMRMRISGNIEELLVKIEAHYLAANSQAEEEWREFSQAARLALLDEKRFCTIKRYKFWNICYEGQHSRLELVLTESKAQWLLYGKADRNLPGNAALRKTLEMPIAQMTVNLFGGFLDGKWQFCIPTTRSFNVNMEGCGTLVPSFKARLGLMKHLEKQVWSSWKVSMAGDTGLQSFDINGLYKLLPDCGTATNNLHRRESAVPDKFLFLDPHRIGDPKDDQFVIASDHRRLRYGEHRMVEAIIGMAEGEPNWRPNSKHGVQIISCIAKGEWIDCAFSLVAVTDDIATFATLKNSITVSDVDAPKCQGANMVALSCEFDVADGQAPNWPSNQWHKVDAASERSEYANLAWLIERVRHLRQFDGRWREIGALAHHSPCNVCSPAKPSIKWKLAEPKTTKTTKTTNATATSTTARIQIVPFEVAAEAGPYERAIKRRPSPISTHVKLSDGKCQLEVSINVVTLVHRAIARLTQHTFDSERPVLVTWKLDTHYDPANLPSLPKITLPSNKGDKPMEHVFENSSKTPKPKLRLEQQRSLRWMVEQESDTVKPFPEEEVEECLVAPLGWLLQARATRRHVVRGGVLADKVGYGKTITVLALIDRQQENICTTPVRGYIRIKATIIIVPFLLISQWLTEILAFLGKGVKVLIIRNITALTKATISDFQSADIILVSHTIGTSEAYLRRVAWLAARPEAPANLQGRALTIWFSESENEIRENVEELKGTKDFRSFDHELETKLRDAVNDEDLLERIPSKRFKGEAYLKSKTNGASKAPATMVDTAPSDGEQLAQPKKVDSKQAANSAQTRPEDPFGLQNAEALGSMTGPVFQMFIAERLIIDEYTYLDQKDCIPLVSFPAEKRWVLSGTPDIDGHAEVKRIGSLVGVNLGVDDDGRGVMKGHNMASSQKDKTDAEVFASFTQAQSSDWHERRHAQAEAFVKQFVRQNEAEIGEIPSDSNYRATVQHCAERAFYLELQTQLYGQDMQLVRGGSSNVANDYQNRLHEMILTSASPEEALLKRCSVLEIESSDSKAKAINALKMTVDVRRSEYEEHRQNLIEQLGEAAAMKQHCGKEDTHYERWVKLVKKNEYGDRKATRRIVKMIREAHKSLEPAEARVVNKSDVKQRRELDDPVKQLRELKDALHKTALEFVTRIRMWRFLKQLRSIQKRYRKREKRIAFTPDCCKKETQKLDGLSILALCGHSICEHCLSHNTSCPVTDCTGTDSHPISVEDLIRRKTTVRGPKHFGTKIEDLVKLIQEIKNSDTSAQILLFVQYDGIRQVINKAFTAAQVSFATITGAELKQTAENKIMQEFKGEGARNATPRTVLMLDASSSCAAGHNITRANHVIFVSPFLAANNHDYHQLYEQAVGRARRFGQKKTVHVHHLVCLDTIDVDIIQDATGKKVVATEGGGIELAEPDESNAGRGYGTVRFSARRAVVVGDEEGRPDGEEGRSDEVDVEGAGAEG